MAVHDLLRERRRGRWLAWSGPALEADVAALADGWRAAGLRAGDGVAAVGPLSAPLVLTLLAARAIGASVRPTTARLAAAASHVLVDGIADLEAVLARGPRRHGTIVIAHPLHGDLPPRTIPFGALLASGIAQVDAGTAGPPENVDDVRGPRVLAEFDPAWAPGLAWMQHRWLAEGATLILPEPGGDAWADRAAARPDALLADAGVLAAAARDLAARLPARLPAWQRWRAGRVLGLRSGLRLLGNEPLPDDVRALFARLGIEAAGERAPLPDWPLSAEVAQ